MFKAHEHVDQAFYLLGAVEIVQWVKPFLCKLENLRWGSRNPRKRLGVVIYVCNFSVAFGMGSLLGSHGPVY